MSDRKETYKRGAAIQRLHDVLADALLPPDKTPRRTRRGMVRRPSKGGTGKSR
jgi:hypothetical protein